MSMRNYSQELNRCRELLKATYDLLNAQMQSEEVLNILETTVHYDDVDCDGECLMYDIASELVTIGCNKTTI